ncbi:MAG: YciI family protein [Bacteroidales bacterium]|nr:YciI family protein [Bacteroidales bacterium]MCF8404966.1 YciI family protein [Bacteroidales bacterium]
MKAYEMKNFSILIFLIAMIACQQPKVNIDMADSGGDSFEYDSTMAAKVGADEYGMKQYVMAFLKRGPNRPEDSAKSVELQRAHLDNIIRMAEEGTLVLAGPFLDNGDIRGIYIFNVATVEEAKALTESDPAIQYGSLKMELIPWYGSAALLDLNDLHKKYAKKGI